MHDDQPSTPRTTSPGRGRLPERQSGRKLGMPSSGIVQATWMTCRCKRAPSTEVGGSGTQRILGSLRKPGTQGRRVACGVRRRCSVRWARSALLPGRALGSAAASVDPQLRRCPNRKARSWWAAVVRDGKSRRQPTRGPISVEESRQPSRPRRLAGNRQFAQLVIGAMTLAKALGSMPISPGYPRLRPPVRKPLLIACCLLAGLAGCRPGAEPRDRPLSTGTPIVQPACDPDLELRVHRSQEDYRVRGNSLEELRTSMAPNRFRDSAGMAWDAFTWWQVQWSYPFIERIGSCALGREHVSVEIRIHLPRWDPPPDADPQLVTSWNKYLAALEAHEEGHVQIALAAACEIRDVLRTLEAQSDCDRMEREADRATQAVIDRYHELEERFDIETNHGASDGAVLP